MRRCQPISAGSKWGDLFTLVRGRCLLGSWGTRWDRALFTLPNLYSPLLHVVPRGAWGATQAILAALGGLPMQHPGCELRRISLLPRTRLNKGHREVSAVAYTGRWTTDGKGGCV